MNTQARSKKGPTQRTAAWQQKRQTKPTGGQWRPNPKQGRWISRDEELGLLKSLLENIAEVERLRKLNHALSTKVREMREWASENIRELVSFEVDVVPGLKKEAQDLSAEVVRLTAELDEMAVSDRQKAEALEAQAKRFQDRTDEAVALRMQLEEQEIAIANAREQSQNQSKPECLVCLENLLSADADMAILLPCKHVFCSNCIHQLEESRNRTCPVCRARISRAVFGLHI